MEAHTSELLQEMRKEYLKYLKEPNEESADVGITFAEVYVWFYNKNSQRALAEAKKVFDQLPKNGLGQACL